MPRGLTPLERHIRDQGDTPTDRRRRWEKAAYAKGLVRVSVMVPAERAEDLKRVARDMRGGDAE